MIVGGGRWAAVRASSRPARLAVVLLAVVATTGVAGCAVPPPSTNACNLPAAPGRTSNTVTVDGQPRTYLMTVPPAYTGTAPMPVVFDFHGAGSTAEVQDVYTQMSVKAAPLGWIVVMPQAVTAGSLTLWSLPPESSTDVHFVDAMIRSIASRLCVDRRRMFATGLSDGAALADALVCARPGTFAAVAPVGGVNTAAACAAGTPRAALVAFHGTADPIFPYGGNATFRSVPQAMADDAVFDGCTGAPTTSSVAWDVTHTVYRGCKDGTALELYSIIGGGHNWPDGYEYTTPYGRMTTSINATDIMLHFFAGHPRSG